MARALRSPPYPSTRSSGSRSVGSGARAELGPALRRSTAFSRVCRTRGTATRWPDLGKSGSHRGSVVLADVPPGGESTRGVIWDHRLPKRQEGNGHGDVVRLLLGNSSKGSASRGMGAAARRSIRKRGEPHGRQRGATNPQPLRGVSRRGGEKPRGRNELPGWYPVTEAVRGLGLARREWTRDRSVDGEEQRIS